MIARKIIIGFMVVLLISIFGCGDDKPKTKPGEEANRRTPELPAGLKEYTFTFNIDSGKRKLDVKIEVDPPEGKAVSGTTENGKVAIKVKGKVDDKIKIKASHAHYSVPTISDYILGEKTGVPIGVKIPIITLSVKCKTVDGRDTKDPVTVLMWTADRKTELVRLSTKLNTTKSLTILKPKDQIVLTGSTSHGSRYTLDAPVRYKVKDGINAITLQFGMGKEVTIEIVCKDEEGNLLSDVELHASNIMDAEGKEVSFTTIDKGRYSCKGYGHAGRKIEVTASKEMYSFDKQPTFTIGPKYNFEDIIIGRKKQIPPATLSFQAVIGNTDTPIPGVLFRVKDQERSTDNNGKATLKIDASDGETLALQATPTDGFQGPTWNTPSRNSLSITAERNYSLKASFQRLPLLRLTLLNARDDKPIQGAELRLNTGEVFGKTDENGQLTRHFPKGTDTLNAVLVADGYLEGPYVAKVSADIERSERRYLLPIQLPKYRIGLGQTRFDLILSADIRKRRAEIKSTIADTMKDEFSRTNIFRWVDELDAIDSTVPMWNEKVNTADFVIMATLRDLSSSNPKFFFDLYSVESGELIGSTFVENVSLAKMSAAVRRQIIPQFLSTFSIIGYVTGEDNTGLEINIGASQSVKTGDSFRILNATRDAQGKVTDEQEIEGRYEVVSASSETAVIEFPESERINPGSSVERVPSTGRTVGLTVTNVLNNDPVAWTKVYWKTEGEENWLFAGATDSDGKVTFEAGLGPITIMGIYTGMQNTRKYPAGRQAIYDTLVLKLTSYTLTIETVPADCEIQISSGTGDASQSYSGTSGSPWQCSTGRYVIEVTAPGNIYQSKTRALIVPPPKDEAQRNLEQIRVEGNKIWFTISLEMDCRKALNNAIAEGKPVQDIIDIAMNASPDNADFRACMIDAGLHVLNRGRPRKAKVIFQRVFDNGHRDAPVHYAIAMSMCHKDYPDASDPEAEITSLGEAIKMLNIGLQYVGNLKLKSSAWKYEHLIRSQIVRAYYLMGDVQQAKVTYMGYEDCSDRIQAEIEESNNPESHQELLGSINKTLVDLKVLLKSDG